MKTQPCVCPTPVYCVFPAVLPAHHLHDPPNRFHYSIKNKDRNERLRQLICSITLQRMYFRLCFKRKELKTEAWRGKYFPRGTQTEIAKSKFKSRVWAPFTLAIVWPFLSLFRCLFLNYLGGPTSFFFLLFHKNGRISLTGPQTFIFPSSILGQTQSYL